jgi:hypothetical protein
MKLKSSDDKREARVVVLYTPKEYSWLKEQFARSTCHTVSGYIRKVSLENPVEIAVRNVSFDEFVGEIIQLQKEMDSIRKETPFTHEQLERLIRLHGDIKSNTNKIVELCMPPSKERSISTE